MKRERSLRRLDLVWQDFQKAHAGLTEAECLEPGVTGKWSVRDILAHVTTWEEEALKHLPLLLRGETPPRYSTTYGGIDAFNAKTTDAKKHLSLEEVFEQMEEVHRRLVGYLESVPEKQFDAGTRFRKRLRLDTYGHYPKHAAAIRKWRLQRGLQSKPALFTSSR